jgi:hypothetical protein
VAFAEAAWELVMPHPVDPALVALEFAIALESQFVVP